MRQKRFESNLHFWQDRRRRFKDPVVVRVQNNDVRSDKVDPEVYGEFLSTCFQRGHERYFMFEGKEKAELFAFNYRHKDVHICEDPKP
jgi:hypothetical protein